MITIEELVKNYEQCGAFLRRKGASPDNPSVLYSLSDVLSQANDEITRLESELKAAHASERVAIFERNAAQRAANAIPKDT